MVKKIKKYAKFIVCIVLIMGLIAPSYAALSASDGSAFVTKAEFDSALADFNARLTTFEAGINSKIDSQVTSYLDRNGIWNGKLLETVIGKHSEDFLAESGTWEPDNSTITTRNAAAKAIVNISGKTVCLLDNIPKSGLLFFEFNFVKGTSGVYHCMTINAMQYVNNGGNFNHSFANGGELESIFWLGENKNSSTWNSIDKQLNSMEWITKFQSVGYGEGTDWNWSTPPNRSLRKHHATYPDNSFYAFEDFSEKVNGVACSLMPTTTNVLIAFVTKGSALWVGSEFVANCNYRRFLGMSWERSGNIYLNVSNARIY